MLDDIDREAMQEGRAISKLRGFQGSRDRSRHEKIKIEQAWNQLRINNELSCRKLSSRPRRV